jgi:hypothetical protein
LLVRSSLIANEIWLSSLAPAVNKLLLIEALLPPYRKTTVTGAYEYWAAALKSTSMEFGPKRSKYRRALSLINQPVTKTHGYCRYE